MLSCEKNERSMDCLRDGFFGELRRVCRRRRRFGGEVSQAAQAAACGGSIQCALRYQGGGRTVFAASPRALEQRDRIVFGRRRACRRRGAPRSICGGCHCRFRSEKSGGFARCFGGEQDGVRPLDARERLRGNLGSRQGADSHSPVGQALRGLGARRGAVEGFCRGGFLTLLGCRPALGGQIAGGRPVRDCSRSCELPLSRRKATRPLRRAGDCHRRRVTARRGRRGNYFSETSCWNGCKRCLIHCVF